MSHLHEKNLLILSEVKDQKHPYESRLRIFHLAIFVLLQNADLSK